MIAAILLLASSPDPMFGPDKARHAAGSFILFTSACTLMSNDCGTRNAAGITISAGLLKEIYDWKKKGHFSWQDLLWDGVGLALGAGAIWVGRNSEK